MKINFSKKIILCLLLTCSLTSFGQSSNDQCSGVVALTLGAPCTSGSIVTANTLTGDPTTKPTCWNDANSDGVWYKFTATATTAFINTTATAAGPTYAPMIAVYNGGASPGSCPTATAISIASGCLNYIVSGGTTAENEVSLTGLTVNNVYYVLVDMPAAVTGNFCIKAFTGPPATVTGSVACPNSVTSSVSLMTCADVGTSNLENSAGATIFSGASTTAPPVAPTCGGTPSEGSWAHYDLASGVTTLTFNWETAYGGSTDMNASAGIYMQVYQGTSCAALTTFSCAQVGSASGSSFFVNSAVVQNLNPAQDVWVYMYQTGATSKFFTLPFDAVGSATPPNDVCSGSIMSATGCNLGSIGDGWGTGGTNLVAAPETAIAGGNTSTCLGTLNWGSNENTVWYTFSATTTTANISVSNVICNNGVAGNAQFAAFTSCACPLANGYVGNACFLGCAVGSGSINIGSLSPGQTVYLAVDGSAGDVCKMNFNTTLVLLPVTWMDFYAKKSNNDVKLFWSTVAEDNSDYFEVERTIDGVDFYPIGIVNASGTSGTKIEYSFTDFNLSSKQVYYRIKQVDKDEIYSYSKMISVDFDTRMKIPEISYNQNEKSIIIKFDTKYFKNYGISILDPFGKSIYNTSNMDGQDSDTYTIPASQIESGVYIVSMKSKDGSESFTNKVVIY